MAVQTFVEKYENVVLDIDKLTMTEHLGAAAVTYDLKDLLRRWSGREGVTITLSQDVQLRKGGGRS